MNYLLADKNTLVWFVFTVYAITAIFIVPNTINFKTQDVAIDVVNQQALQFASRFIMRLVLILPMVILLKSSC